MITRTNKAYFAAATASLAAIVAMSLALETPPVEALPTFAHQNGVPCSTCHSIAPKLNINGLAFEANYFNWPGGPPPEVGKGIKSVPLSALITNTWGGGQGINTGAQFQTAELFAAGGFSPYAGRGGGYWVDYLAGSNNGTRPGFLDGAWVAAPIAGSRGQLALKIGQFAPINYQWEGISTLQQSLPTATDDPIDNISLDASTPAVNLEYFSNRGKRTANGLYVNAGMLMGGHITLNKESRLYAAQGGFVHAFERKKFDTIGVYAYRDGSATQEGAIATRQITKQLSVLGIGAVGGDVNGNQQHLSGEGDYVLNPELAFSVRYDIIRGVTHTEYPVGTVTWYPFYQRAIRISGESSLQGGSRTNTVFAQLQL